MRETTLTCLCGHEWAAEDTECARCGIGIGELYYQGGCGATDAARAEWEEHFTAARRYATGTLRRKGWAAQRTIPPADMAELVTDAVGDAWARYLAVRERETPRSAVGLILRCVRLGALDAWRSYCARPGDGSDGLDAVAESGPVCEDGWAVPVLLALPERQRNVAIALAGGASYREIAADLDVSVGTVAADVAALRRHLWPACVAHAVADAFRPAD